MEMSPGSREFVTGHSVRGRPVRSWRFGADDGAPAVLFAAGCHAIEFIGVEQCAAVAGRLVKERARLLEETAVWFMPVINPDGHYSVRDRLRRHRVPLVKTNANRVDLNRNFPVGFYEPHRGIMAGSHRKTINYHGPAPLSEPESKAFVELVDMSNPALAMQLHSFGGSFIFPPCHHRGETPDHETFMRLGEQMAALQKQDRYSVASVAQGMYSTYGDIDDWLYYERGVLAYTLEIGRFGLKSAPPWSWWNIFMWTNPRDVAAALDNNTDACLRLVEAAAGGVAAKSRSGG